MTAPITRAIRLLAFALVLGFPFSQALGITQESDELRVVAVPGAELHYVDRGEGRAVVFVHGGLEDYREWLPVASRLGRIRTIAYSRRYNYPNGNVEPPSATFSAREEARDLAALVERLRVAPADVVGVSYGAYTALLLAIDRPELVRRLVLVEAPLIGWLPRIRGGASAAGAFRHEFWLPLSRALAVGDRDGAFAIAVRYFAGPGAIDAIPPEARDAAMANMREWEALSRSSDPFPLVSRTSVRRVRVPVLLISGGKSYPVARIVDPVLAKTLPHSRRIVVSGGTHDVCTELPDVCAAAIGDFLRR